MIRSALVALPLTVAGLLLGTGALAPADITPTPTPASTPGRNDLCALAAVANGIAPALAGIARPGETPGGTSNRVARHLDCSMPKKRSAAYDARACIALTPAGIRALGDALGTPTTPDVAAVAAARRTLRCDP